MAEYDIQSRGFDPAGTLLRALQFRDIARQQEMRPEQELMQYQRLLPLLESLPPDEAAQIERKFLGTSTFAPQRAGKLKESYRKDMESNAMLKLAEMEHQFRARTDAEMSRLETLAQRFPDFNLNEARAELLDQLTRERQSVLQNFERDYRNVLPRVQSSFEQTKGKYGPEGTRMELLGAAQTPGLLPGERLGPPRPMRTPPLAGVLEGGRQKVPMPGPYVQPPPGLSFPRQKRQAPSLQEQMATPLYWR